MNPRRLRLFGAVCAAYVLAFASAWLAGLRALGAPSSVLVWAPAVLAPLGTFALVAAPLVPARRYLLNLTAATLAVPIGLLFAAATLEPAASAPQRPVAGLDTDRLFAGAATVQDTDLRAAGITLMRAGAFADASELRLMRFAEPDAAGQYLAMLAQAAQGEPFDGGGRRGVRLLSGMPGALILLEQHGADLLELRAREAASGLARLAAQGVPVATPLAAAAEPAPRWPWLAGGALVHAISFVALVVWAARWTAPQALRLSRPASRS
jgi:hypothetical protein